MLSNFSEHFYCEINQPQLDSTDATYLSKFSTTEFLKSITFILKRAYLPLKNNSQFYSILAHESSDISSKDELAICGRWLENGKVVECSYR